MNLDEMKSLMKNPAEFDRHFGGLMRGVRQAERRNKMRGLFCLWFVVILLIVASILAAAYWP